jgi:hypothetical protein
LLLERIGEKGEPRPPRQIKPDFRIVARESTGTVASGGSPADGAEVVEQIAETGVAGVHAVAQGSHDRG